MKRVITVVWPFLLLVLALTFMTKYKQLDDLSDTERYEIRTYVEAAEENEQDTASTDGQNGAGNAVAGEEDSNETNE